jgi:NitT/TauT family transport system permease protein
MSSITAKRTTVAARRPVHQLVPREPKPLTIRAWQVAIVVVVIVAWQWVPDIPGIRSVFDFADPFFISSPYLLAKELWALALGQHGTTPIWTPLAHTVLTALIGSAAACALGAVAGLAVSNWTTLDRITRPFLVVLNAIPRVAMIPIIVLLAKNPSTSDALTALTVVFFLVFYNAAAGASSVPTEIVQNAELMGASKLRVMWRVRWPYAMGWTLITLPNAIAFGLVGSVTAEIFTGSTGLGYDLVLAIDNSNANLLFAIVVVLAIIGVILVLGSSWLRRILMPWWETSQGI